MAGGRPTKRTKEVEVKIGEALRAGNTRKAACHYAGISQETFCTWVEQFPEFSELVKKAEADCEVAFVAVIKKAAVGHPATKIVTKSRTINGVTETETTTTEYTEYSWQAGAWWLERRKPEDYARFVLDPGKLSSEQIADLLGSGKGGTAPGDSGNSER